MTNTPRVLVVDGLAETETVLRAVLEPQGARVERRRGSDRDECESAPPQVVVVDLDDRSHGDRDWSDVPCVMLSSRPCDATDRAARFLEKPFHYPELVSLIRSLLDLPTERRRVG